MCSSNFLYYHTLGNEITLFIVATVNDSQHELWYILINIYIHIYSFHSLSTYEFYKLYFLILHWYVRSELLLILIYRYWDKNYSQCACQRHTEKARTQVCHWNIMENSVNLGTPFLYYIMHMTQVVHYLGYLGVLTSFFFPGVPYFLFIIIFTKT